MLEEILRQVQAGKMTIDEAKEKLKTFDHLGFATVDLHRPKRQGFPEVVFGEGKTAEQIIAIVRTLKQHHGCVLVTRVSPAKAEAVQSAFPDLIYHEAARLLYWKDEQRQEKRPKGYGYIAVICAGTSDLGVAEEAAVTAELFDCEVRRFYDVGVAGIHRLFHHIEAIRAAAVSVVVAGMEGALPSVVSGLVSHPVIAVPTSIGYGANFQGLSALLTMLNSCAPGISVVNIDNGFGGGYNAALICRLVQEGAK
ncbi:nickel pincer cofactor biosynthesis protein LarB [Geobacillus subterraneus]|uniref:nickel pincer cofactor biosynthesis protein LarB n=1 Tax=Geobacillus subterraneus TaxID=129338 RepID=UPI002AC896AE|nr:nickel pincer cofactor biosynthesis protein LarB [Geobacillus subterraneus]WPZ19298.1 nickel pincer cofactor biosynthesis protein LarB [Geobacillus subterraneus]